MQKINLFRMVSIVSFAQILCILPILLYLIVGEGFSENRRGGIIGGIYHMIFPLSFLIITLLIMFSIACLDRKKWALVSIVIVSIVLIIYQLSSGGLSEFLGNTFDVTCILTSLILIILGSYTLYRIRG